MRANLHIGQGAAPQSVRSLRSEVATIVKREEGVVSIFENIAPVHGLLTRKGYLLRSYIY